jgi:5'-nucleotidase/UDP-sugar diphosphatase
MKQRLIVKTALSAAILATLAGCATQPAHEWNEDTTYKLTVLHTNDHHGRFWQNKYGEYGMAARKTLIDELRAEIQAEGGSVLLLSGGDINTGVPESDLQDAEPDFKGMSKIGYDAMALGNHEFDNPLGSVVQTARVGKLPNAVCQHLRQRNRRASVPTLCHVQQAGH